ncbi:nucleoside hydrolase [Lactobacillus jensenii]|jgi:inosine-uridine nucleoside N-ribohydrolase|uniref:ABC transporter substrate-binding protein n=1 Tax=Lactobacillus jensenii TaxID=109790 RepID=A0A5N1IBU7_LACJE|nr:nucleoside hydrolase [Lactobacillus jensenii]EEQ68118.1 Inosine-uridine preferring nucleoside hydrolase [Lactobacillus jensenii 1153]APT14912.1 ABC transporter substrate-binding protein [Lactobacillus jensenii]EEQ24430.1 Inosine-uridine preferring nucleoside hydrolase [Lactobacillus jensenii 269-3]KAA9236629.1 ABC transporter substrate-binding protein [Lactobacillus jensenii]KAA9259262.1 ABC transporter substrate-binding protein [Lactobacillus jensenii]
MKNIYFNHDGNTDDLVSLLLLLQAPDINLIGVSAIDGDGDVVASCEASRKIIDRFNTFNHKLEVAMSNSRAHHQFPEEWRQSTFTFNSFPILNEHGKINTPAAKNPAHIDMAKKIMAQDERTTVIMTGPITDLARALDYEPKLANKIDKLYWMGGSLDGHGNVFVPYYDTTQEWNAFWDPEAVERVWNSDIDIQMVGLESTEEIPLNDELKQHFASLRRYPAMDLIGLGYSLIISSQPGNQYYLWDVLTTLSALYPDLVETRKAKSYVLTEGAAAGRLVESEKGRPMTLVTKADKDAFFKKFDELALSANFK